MPAALDWPFDDPVPAPLAFPELVRTMRFSSSWLVDWSFRAEAPGSSSSLLAGASAPEGSTERLSWIRFPPNGSGIGWSAPGCSASPSPPVSPPV